MTVLVTGGTGFIDSHNRLPFWQAGDKVVVLDNLSNGFAESLHRVQGLVGKPLVFFQGYIRGTHTLQQTFSNYGFLALAYSTERTRM